MQDGPVEAGWPLLPRMTAGGSIGLLRISTHAGIAQYAGERQVIGLGAAAISLKPMALAVFQSGTRRDVATRASARFDAQPYLV